MGWFGPDKKGKDKKDTYDDDLFGGLFDINGDGKTDFGEEYIAYRIFEDVMGGDKEDDDDNGL